MKLVETELTPELAGRLLANPHPRQRRISRATVETYARAIREGRWRLVDDPLLVVGATHAGESDPDGSLFNGGHRCLAVVAAHRSIPIYIDWDADPSTFDLIDIGRKRSAYQFVPQTFATSRVHAARLLLWYRHRFDRPPAGVNLAFDLHEVLSEVESSGEAFEITIPLASRTYEYTGLSVGVALAAYTIALGYGYREEIETFVEGVCDPLDLPPTAPSRLLSERFRKQTNRARRRDTVEDWTILVRALNLHLQGRGASRLVLGEIWPKVAESEADFTRRRNALSLARARVNEANQSHKSATA